MTPPRTHAFERAVLGTIRRSGLLRADDHVLVALSGGPDSTALLAALLALAARGAVGCVSACHVDHRLRPDSGADGAFCAELCAALGVPLHQVAIDGAREGNVQAWARRERYRALTGVAARCGASIIATGHTRSDQAETVLLRLLRGAGARGLAAIPLRRGRIVRPLLERSRREVLGYLADRGLGAREDPTNRSPRYLRNRIRHEVLPALEALAPGAEKRLARTAALLRDDERLLERLARALVPSGVVSTPVTALCAAPLSVRRRAIRRMWHAATGSRRGLSAGHVDDVLKLVRRPSPGSIDLPHGFVATVAYGSIEIRPSARAEGSTRPAFDPIVVAAEGRYTLPGGSEVELRWNGSERPPWPLEVRTRRPGDRFRPAGGRGSKKLKAWLIDRKIPRARRDALVVVADRTGRILAMPELGLTAEGAGALTVFLWASV